MRTVSNKFTFITYADDTTLSAPMVSFVSGSNYNIHSNSKGINSEIKKYSKLASCEQVVYKCNLTKVYGI